MADYKLLRNSTKKTIKLISPSALSNTVSMQAPKGFAVLNVVKRDETKTAGAHKPEPKAAKKKRNAKRVKSDDEDYIDEPVPEEKRGRKKKDKDPNSDRAARPRKRSAKAADKQVRSIGALKIT